MSVDDAHAELRAQIRAEAQAERETSLAADSPNFRLLPHRGLRDGLGKWAYPRRKLFSDLTTWREAVGERAEAHQAIYGASRPVTPEVTEQIAIEVADWVWERFDGPKRMP